MDKIASDSGFEHALEQDDSRTIQSVDHRLRTAFQHLEIAVAILNEIIDEERSPIDLVDVISLGVLDRPIEDDL